MSDWRIDNAHFLKGQKFVQKSYKKPSDSWDHDHCSACMAKFAEFDGTDIQHEGFASCKNERFSADYHWICIGCFADLKDELGWSRAP